MNSARRQFLEKAFKLGGLAALAGLGVQYPLARAIAAGVNGVTNPAAVNGVATPDKVCGVSGLAGACNAATDSIQVALASISANTTGVDSAGNWRGVAWQDSGGITVTRIGIYCVDLSSGTGSIVAELKAYDTTNDIPTGSVLATCTVASSSLPDPVADYYFEFTTPYTLTDTNWYCIYFYGINSASMNVYRDSTASAPIPVYIYSYDSGSTWTESAGAYDLRGPGIRGCA